MARKLGQDINNAEKRYNGIMRILLDLSTNGSIVDDYVAPRQPEYGEVQDPRYRLELKWQMPERIDTGHTIDGITVTLRDDNNRPVETGPLASATVELVVVDGEFNKYDNQYNWSRKEFESKIIKNAQGNPAVGDVDQPTNSIVSKGRFNLVHGSKCHSGFKICRNSGNKKVRLGVMVVPPTKERVLEGLSSDHFLVRDHGRPRKQSNKLRRNCSNRQGSDAIGEHLSLSGNTTTELSLRQGQPAMIPQKQSLHWQSPTQPASGQNGHHFVDVPCANKEHEGGMSYMQYSSSANTNHGIDKNGQPSPSLAGITTTRTEPSTTAMMPQTAGQLTMTESMTIHPTGSDLMRQQDCPFLRGHPDIPSTELSIGQGQHATTPQKKSRHLETPTQPANNRTKLHISGQPHLSFAGNTTIPSTGPSTSGIQQHMIPQTAGNPWQTMVRPGIQPTSVGDRCQEQNSSMTKMQHTSLLPNSTQGLSLMRQQLSLSGNPTIPSTEQATGQGQQATAPLKESRHLETPTQSANNRTSGYSFNEEDIRQRICMQNSSLPNTTHGGETKLHTSGQPHLSFAGNTTIPSTGPSTTAIQQHRISQTAGNTWQTMVRPMFQPTGVGDGCQEQNSSMTNMQRPSLLPNSTQGLNLMREQLSPPRNPTVPSSEQATGWSVIPTRQSRLGDNWIDDLIYNDLSPIN